MIQEVAQVREAQNGGGVERTLPDRLLSAPEAAKYLGTTANRLANLRSRREGPSYVKIGRAVRYRLADLEAFVEQHMVNTSAGAGDREG